MNTVTIDLKEYNKLRDFKKAFDDGATVTITTYKNECGFQLQTDHRQINPDEAFNVISSQICELQKRLDEDNNRHVSGKEILKKDLMNAHYEIIKIKKFTSRQFRQWKRCQK